MEKQEKQENMVSLKELEKDLATAEALKYQLENTWQQVIGRIECLRSLIKRAKGEVVITENNPKEELK